jgi:RNA polymerase sigma-70 factor (ECF subfamily)
MTTRGVSKAVGREEAEDRFERLYADHGRAVLAYAVRRVNDPQDGADVVAETFLVAWRRLDEVPASDAARLWLYRVARYVLANRYRSERRRERLAERLRHDLSLAFEDVPRPGSDTVPLRDALSRLGTEDQEILRLCGWEELTPREIATVLGISHVAARSRLHRARRRLRAALGPEPDPELEDTGALRLQEAR